jgi:hypothetical protein
MLRTSALGYVGASQACINAGGNLVLYKSFDEQLLVERYLGRTKWVAAGQRLLRRPGAGAACRALAGPHRYWPGLPSLLQQPRSHLSLLLPRCAPSHYCSPARSMLPTTSYWVGISRDDNTVPFAFIDGTTIPQTASNSPWAHWSSQTNTLAYDATKATWNCVQVGAEGRGCSPPAQRWHRSCTWALPALPPSRPAARATPTHAAAARATTRARASPHTQVRRDMAYELYVGDETPANQVDKTKYFNSSDYVYGWQPQDCASPLQYVCEVPPGAFPCMPPPSPPIAAICEWLGCWRGPCGSVPLPAGARCNSPLSTARCGRRRRACAHAQPLLRAQRGAVLQPDDHGQVI